MIKKIVEGLLILVLIAGGVVALGYYKVIPIPYRCTMPARGIDTYNGMCFSIFDDQFWVTSKNRTARWI